MINNKQYKKDCRLVAPNAKFAYNKTIYGDVSKVFADNYSYQKEEWFKFRFKLTRNKNHFGVLIYDKPNPLFLEEKYFIILQFDALPFQFNVFIRYQAILIWFVFFKIW